MADPPDPAERPDLRAAAATLAEDAAATLARSGPPVLLGVAGGVAAGKSTVAAALLAALAERGRRAEVLATDAFLLPNAELERRDLAMRKGFPESYDAAGLAAALGALRAGEAVAVPVYSHLTYDRVQGATRTLDGTALDVLVVEGVNALQPAVAGALHTSVFVDAAEDDAWRWFLERFLRLCDEGRDDPGSFYAALAPLGRDDQRAVAAAAWDGINVVNLREHVLPTRARATWVLAKGPDHRVRSLERRPA